MINNGQNTSSENEHLTNLLRNDLGISKRYSCETCSYATDKKFNLNKRITSKHDKAKNKEPLFSCKICSHLTTKNSNIIRHQKIVHGKAMQSICELCTFGCNNQKN